MHSIASQREKYYREGTPAPGGARRGPAAAAEVDAGVHDAGVRPPHSAPRRGRPQHVCACRRSSLCVLFRNGKPATWVLSSILRGFMRYFAHIVYADLQYSSRQETLSDRNFVLVGRFRFWQYTNVSRRDLRNTKTTTAW